MLVIADDGMTCLTTQTYWLCNDTHVDLADHFLHFLSCNSRSNADFLIEIHTALNTVNT